jgi:hypothetical protein
LKNHKKSAENRNLGTLVLAFAFAFAFALTAGNGCDDGRPTSRLSQGRKGKN